MKRMELMILCMVGVCLAGADSALAEPWKRHTVDDSSKGADGVRLEDFDRDGLPDIATGWEEGGVVRIYRNPGAKDSRKPWPQVTVGKVKSAEDAVMADLDRDGAMDVISACEGGTRTLFAHWAPKDQERWQDASAWTTAKFPEKNGGRQAWMFTVPVDVDGRNRVDLVTGSKSNDAAVGWWKSPEDPRKLEDWQFIKLYDASWIMTVRAHDMDGDGDADIVFSDRKGSNRGVYWLEHPGSDKAESAEAWKLHKIWSGSGEVMFLAMGDLNGDGREDIAAAVKPRSIAMLVAPKDGPQGEWSSKVIDFPEKGYGTAKGVAIDDLNGDGLVDIAGTCEHGEKEKSGAFLLRGMGKGLLAGEYETEDIGGPLGIKFDRIELLDLDGDGDKDLLTCEERDQLGVIWYENPAK